MRKRTLLIVAVATLAAGFAPAPKPKEDAKDDLKKLQGTWKMVSLTRDGKSSTPPETNAVVEGDQWTYQRAGVKLKASAMTVVLDPKSKPKSFEFRRGGKPGSLAFKGIYAFDKDSLKISYTPGSAAPPKDFTGAGPKQIVLTFQREKP